MSRLNLEEALTEQARLRNRLGKQSESIWSMSKADLVEVARRELGLRVAKANEQTVITLREMIRRQRDIQKMTTDPLAKAPPGLTSMKKDLLQAEMSSRNLPWTEKSTRPQIGSARNGGVVPCPNRGVLRMEEWHDSFASCQLSNRPRCS